MKQPDFSFKDFQFMIHPAFFKTLVDKKINDFKLHTPEIIVYAEMINDFARVQQLSNTTGLRGRVYLLDSLKEFEASKCTIESFTENYFEIHLFADIKQYQFTYKIYYSNIDNHSREFIEVNTMQDAQNLIKLENKMRNNVNSYIKCILNACPVGAFIEVTSPKSKTTYKVISEGKLEFSIISLPVQTVDLKSILDPATLVYESSMLNLSLMKWRLVPELDLEKNKKLKCLILGVGTLGCNLIRALLGWGVVKFTLVDSGVVSYSNPVRQSLFVVKDVGQPKVDAAKQRILDIAPYAIVNTIKMRIPMPGHLFEDSEIIQLWGLIKENDACFLLTDSRESRWLPTVLSRFENKLCFTAALGFESFLAMRHSPLHGCYFCSDVVAPVNVLCINIVNGG